MNVGWLVLIAAGLEDFVIPAIVILFLAIGALGQVLAKIREAQAAQPPPRRGLAPRPGGARPALPRAADPVRGEVEEFLRDAARRHAGRPQQPEQLRRPPPATDWGAPLPPRSRPPEKPIELEEVELEDAEPTPKDVSVAGHVRQRLAGQKISGLPSKLGTPLSKTDEVVEQRLHKAFHHRLSDLRPGESAQLAQSEEAETPEDRITSLPATAAAGLAAMLADPGSLRQAILLNEILQRPERRWE